jgi:DNA-binding CsgD family transcriptional regulator
VLDVFGVSADDERIYRCLLRQPGTSPEELGRATGQSERDAQLALDRLADLGLVTRLAGRRPRLVATRPDVAVDVLVARKQQELAGAQAAARDLLDELPDERMAGTDEHLEIVVGREAVAHRFRQLQQLTKHELLVLDRPPYAQDLTQPDSSEFDLLGRGVKCRGIYAPEALDLPGYLAGLRDAVAAGEEARIHTAVPMKLAICDRSAAMLPLSRDAPTDSALVVYACTLLDALTSLFEQLWESAIPVPADPSEQPSAPGPVPHDADLLALLAAGLKDESIARQLGISTRTLSRRTGELMEDLGARTRFQCGLQAVRLGLID